MGQVLASLYMCCCFPTYVLGLGAMAPATTLVLLPLLRLLLLVLLDVDTLALQELLALLLIEDLASEWLGAWAWPSSCLGLLAPVAAVLLLRRTCIVN